MIPKIIHQVYENPDVPEYLTGIAGTWKLHHPGWEYRFWDKQAIDQFLSSVYPEHTACYRAFPFDVQRWDAIRYLILYHFGGLYADMDYECIEPFDSLLCGHACCMGMEPALHASLLNRPYIVGNALMASIPKHPYFGKVIEDVFNGKNLSLSGNKTKCLFIMETTGPFMATRIYDGYSPKDEITLLPAELVAPLSSPEVQEVINGVKTEEIEGKIEKAFAVHYFFGSWVP